MPILLDVFPGFIRTIVAGRRDRSRTRGFALRNLTVTGGTVCLCFL